MIVGSTAQFGNGKSYSTTGRKNNNNNATPVVWNSLPPHLRSPSISRNQFRAGLKTHLFKEAYTAYSDNLSELCLRVNWTELNWTTTTTTRPVVGPWWDGSPKPTAVVGEKQRSFTCYHLANAVEYRPRHPDVWKDWWSSRVNNSKTVPLWTKLTKKRHLVGPLSDRMNQAT